MSITITSIIILALSFPFAILLEGIRRKLIARFQNRIGPPIIQPFYDLIKLFKKHNTVEAESSKNLFFYSLPLVSLVLIVLSYSIVFGVLSFDYDFILLVYFLTSIEVFIIIAGFASRSPFSFLGSVRELSFMLAYELLFVFSIISIIWFSGVFSFSNISESGFLTAPIGMIILLISGMPLLKITPFDSPVAGPEISSGINSEYSGKLLFLWDLVDYLKNGLFLFIAGFLVFSSLLWTLPVSLLIIFSYSLNHAVTARYAFIKACRVLLILVLLSSISLVMLL